MKCFRCKNFVPHTYHNRTCISQLQPNDCNEYEELERQVEVRKYKDNYGVYCTESNTFIMTNLTEQSAKNSVQYIKDYVCER